LAVPQILIADPVRAEFYTVLPQEKFKFKRDAVALLHPVQPIIRLSNLYNCWQFLKDSYFVEMPLTATIKSNLVQEYGDMAVFYYEKSGLWHYAKTTGSSTDSFTVDEANYKAGKRTQRSVSFNDAAFRGFYNI